MNGTSLQTFEFKIQVIFLILGIMKPNHLPQINNKQIHLDLLLLTRLSMKGNGIV